MSQLIKTGLAIIFGIIITLWYKSCHENIEIVEVVVPEKPGTFEPQKPIYIYKKDTLYVNKWITKDSIIEVVLNNPVNDSLDNAYKDAMSEIERYKMYISSIQIKDFRNTFEDQFLRIDVTGQVQGDLKFIKSDYLIKERTIPISIKKDPRRFLIGTHIQTSLSDFNYSLNIGLQDRKGSIYRLGYARMYHSNYILLGWDYSLFTF